MHCSSASDVSSWSQSSEQTTSVPSLVLGRTACDCSCNSEHAVIEHVRLAALVDIACVTPEQLDQALSPSAFSCHVWEGSFDCKAKS